MLRKVVSTLFPQDLSVLGIMASVTWNMSVLCISKSIGKSKALAATLSDTEPEDDFDNENDGILNAFTAIVDPTDGIIEDVIEEEKLVESKFEKMNDQDDIHTAYEKLYKLSKKHEKLYRLATKKPSDVELDR